LPSLLTVAFRFPAYFPETSVWWCRAELWQQPEGRRR